jgi:hypothetical protein
LTKKDGVLCDTTQRAARSVGDPATGTVPKVVRGRERMPRRTVIHCRSPQLDDLMRRPSKVGRGPHLHPPSGDGSSRRLVVRQCADRRLKVRGERRARHFSALSELDKGLVRRLVYAVNCRFRATASHWKTARATSFGHALGTAGPAGAAYRLRRRHVWRTRTVVGRCCTLMVIEASRSGSRSC